ncbi:N-acetyltransferase [Marmoricola endophyticus]|uniref:N-acetyltransferase n=1 Tax=Marmoricola endophyticus TaxID=2040280 RepID=A0A917BJ16_9ACTN|nr:GNAT family N-acetyltransferase [Marmoricola endophyticus]GGF44131.1 N-acetyltransferase [Marmoricola endophyticus]
MSRVRPALPDEAPTLSALAFESKAHWGYSASFMESCRAELTVDPAACDGTRVVLAEDDEGVTGFYRIGGTPEEGTLDDLFVAPGRMGRGLGRLLLAHAVRTARSLGMTSLFIDADPHAVGFYERAGAVHVGEVASGSISGRVLPQLRLTTG